MNSLKCLVVAALFAGAGEALAAPGNTLHTFQGSAGDGVGFGVAQTDSRILVGAGGASPGKVYVYDKAAPYNLVKTITGWSSGDRFGYAVSGMGNDILVGGILYSNSSGRAGVYNGPNGLTEKSFSPIGNPHPNSGALFGNAVAPMGNNILVAAERDDPGGAFQCGAVYLFDGALGGSPLYTFQPPVIGPNKDYGFSVAAVGSNKVVIGAQRDGGGDSGITYVYQHSGSDWKTNWALTSTIGSPGGSDFGRSVAALGSSKLLIASLGTSYLYDVSNPTSPTQLPFSAAGGMVATLGPNILTAPESGSFVDLYDGTTYANLLHITASSLGVTSLMVNSIAACDNNILIGDVHPNSGAGVVYLVEAPEPSTFALLGVGAVSLLAYPWRRRKRAA